MRTTDPIHMSKDLCNSFSRCLAYYNSPRFLKPFVNPLRFARNQVRARCRQSPGTVRQADAFHMDNFTCVAGEVVSEVISSYGFLEPNLTGAFLHLVKPGQTAIDIGMHLGYFSTLLARLVGSGGKVYSFEPTPSTRKLAEANTKRFANIQVCPNAVWSHREIMQFHDYGSKYMAFNSVGFARLEHSIDTVQTYEVEAISLDDFRARVGGPFHVIKVDAETAEREIIRGGIETIKLDKPVITMEVGDESSESGASLELINMMRDLDYRCWEFNDGVFSPHQIRSSYEYDNLIFLPADRQPN
jgi:FkbM family methyltransferase